MLHDSMLVCRAEISLMSYLFEYCAVYAKEEYGVDISRIKFIEKFMQGSWIRGLLDEFHVRLLHSAARTVFRAFVEEDLGNDFSSIEGHDEVCTCPMELYWCGWMYALIHCKTMIKAEDIYKKIPISLMMDMYICGHEDSFDRVFRGICDVYDFVELFD